MQASAYCKFVCMYACVHVYVCAYTMGQNKSHATFKNLVCHDDGWFSAVPSSKLV